MYSGALIIAQIVKTCSVRYLFIKLYIHIYRYHLNAATSGYPSIIDLNTSLREGSNALCISGLVWIRENKL